MTTGPNPGGGDHFPGYDVLARAGDWDEITAGVVLSRLGPDAPLRFFTVAEEAVGRPLFDRLLGQEEEPRVPVFELVDARLADGSTDGWRYADMPEDREAWRRSLRHVAEDSHERHGCAFGDLGWEQQRRLLEAIRVGGDWHGLPAARVWNLWMRYACAAFYAHPWSWNEIGFGGPAYPTGYKALGIDAREPWEVRERDAFDPVPWARRVEHARRRQDDTGGDG